MGVEFFNSDNKSILRAGNTEGEGLFKIYEVGADERVVGVRGIMYPTDHEYKGAIYDLKFKIGRMTF